MSALQFPALNRTPTLPSEAGWHRESTPLRGLLRPSDAPIFIIGAYSGTTTQLLIDVHPERVFYLFEPQDWAIRQLRERFGSMPNVRIFPFGLGDRSGTLPMCLYTSDGCTFMKGGIEFKEDPQYWCEGEMMEFSEFMARQTAQKIAHASLNIEGYEYVLLSHLARTGWLERIETLGVSWHGSEFKTVVPGPFTYFGDPVPPWEDMQTLLATTHDLILSIDNWQTWGRRGT